jgi:FAD/FMN-containing dehydrogenase
VTRALDELGHSELAARLGGRLLRVAAPLAACAADPASGACEAALASLRNPYAIEDDPGAFCTSGWHEAYVNQPSEWAVAAESAADIAAAVDFARSHGIRLAVKGTGHDYLGRSSAPGSLLIWTHRMRDTTVHDAFTPAGAPDGEHAVPAITVGAGTRWLEAYQALAGHGRYVQGGGCVTVGAAGGFTQGGGFGGFSRRFGTAAGNMLEAEVVTASGEIVVANAWQHDDLFWALRGGGGGTFGVVTRLTMRTHPVPRTIGRIRGTIQAAGDEEFRQLVRELVRFLPTCCDDHWGGHVLLRPDNSVVFGLRAIYLTDDKLQAAGRPLLDWVRGRPDVFTPDVWVFTKPFDMWDMRVIEEAQPDSIRHDDRPGAPPEQFWWSANENEVSWYLHTFQSLWLPGRLFGEDPDALADAFFEASRHHGIRMDFNKALWRAAPDAVARDRETAMNPAVFDAAALVLTASWQQYAFPGVPGHEPDAELAAAGVRQVTKAMDVIRAIAPGAGSYVNETDYFEPDWQHSFWGENYPRLLQVKQKYDPAGLFLVHHGVGSDLP